MPNLPPSDPALDARLRLMVESFQRLTGKPLIDAELLLPPCRGKVGMGVEQLEHGVSTPSRACVVGALAPYNHGLPLAGVTLPLQGGGDDALRDAIWNAPRAIVAHGTQDDPIFFYGNRLALQLFEMSFDEFAQLPSRFSAEPMAREARAKLLENVTRQGYVDGYCGMRIAKSGKRFKITDGTVWNLVDEAGGLHGQAAVFVALV